MEPKSIAFYTAVAVSILAVLSAATTFPTMAQAQGNPQDEPDEGSTDQQGPEDNQDNQDDSVTNEETRTQSDSEGEQDDSTTADEGGPNQRLGLQPDSGIASCGQVVTEDVTLTSDLNCANGDGLIVGASDITINMNGYSITSGEGADAGGTPTANSGEGADAGANAEGTPTGDAAGVEDPLTTDYDGTSGILVANADNVAIAGLGKIDGFTRGVTFLGSSGGSLSDVQLSGNDIGGVVASSSGVEISRNTMTNNGIAVVFDSSNGGVTAFNQIVANLREGVLLLGSSDNVVAANNMYGNGANGIYLDPMSRGNNIDYNTVFGHDTADLNNADGMPTNVNQNSFGDNNNCGTSLPGGLCR